jgi:1A family penicillin-binding protein
MRDLPLADVLPPLEEPTISVSMIDGQVLTTQGAYRAPYVAYEEFPPHLIEAVLAVEDRRFFRHGGVDFRGIGRALYRNASAGGVVEGGSTITQQLVKILYLEPERTISRKLQEAVLATTLERQLGKERILELYLNSVYLGSGAYGMPAAAETYYGKDVSELSLPEAATLAASIQLPSQVNPISDLGAVQNRGALVLNLMQNQGRINEAQRDAALARLARLAPDPPPTRAGSYFADWVLEEVATLSGASSEALSATATLDPELQIEAERIVREVLAAEGPAANASQAAVVVMTSNGRVRAMIGGLDYAESEFNRATEALRQPGSTFKLFVYMAALVRGAAPENTVSDDPIEVGDWAPRNFDGQSHGIVTLRQAFAASYNQATVRLAQAVETDVILEVARRFGIEAELSASPSLALGASEVTLLDMTEAFAAVALGRTPVNATGIETLRFGEEGDALAISGANDRDQTRLSRTREDITDLLRAVVQEGTGHRAAIPGLDIVGKTGTTQESRDAWFIGFEPSRGVVIGVWVGNDDNSPMNQVTGGGLPAEIFRRVMEAAVAKGAIEGDVPVEQQPRPEPSAQPAQCDIRACSAAYRSFRAEDCTYQPFEGPRRICTR